MQNAYEEWKHSLYIASYYISRKFWYAIMAIQAHT